MENNLDFTGNDPGATKFGNFINYYSFHNTKQRIDHLDTQMFLDPTSNEDIICLDIGCNTGELTRDVYMYLKNIYPKSNLQILAVDIDPTLIRRAREANHNENIIFETADVMEEKGYEITKKFLDSCNKKMFDITLCFSVTMWIHLNHGDEGFLKFLKYLKDISKTIIIESQPFKCYKQAQRRMKKAGSCFPLYEMLKIRNNIESVIEQTLIENSHIKVYESPNSPWDRKIISFHLL